MCMYTHFFGFKRNLTYNIVDIISKIKQCLQEKTIIRYQSNDPRHEDYCNSLVLNFPRI